MCNWNPRRGKDGSVIVKLLKAKSVRKIIKQRKKEISFSEVVIRLAADFSIDQQNQNLSPAGPL